MDDVLVDDWHVVAERDMLKAHAPVATRLLGVDLTIGVTSDGAISVTRSDANQRVLFAERYGFIWACLGSPAGDIIPIPEAEESDRYVLHGGSIAVNVSGLRAVENFLDMGHFPFVHTDYLGAEPHTEIIPYKVEMDDHGILATECKFFQPVASPTASEGFLVDYTYRVFRPYVVALYKSNPLHKDRRDVIVLFAQPVDEENCVAHSYLCYLKEGIDEPSVRWFFQLIFAQDKPILENQLPKRLPLDPRAETPIRADASSVMYRRWLRERAVTYGAIPAPA